jgi:hypothetical protein
MNQADNLMLAGRRGIGLEVNDEVARAYVRPGTAYLGERP